MDHWDDSNAVGVLISNYIHKFQLLDDDLIDSLRNVLSNTHDRYIQNRDKYVIIKGKKGYLYFLHDRFVFNDESNKEYWIGVTMTTTTLIEEIKQCEYYSYQ